MDLYRLSAPICEKIYRFTKSLQFFWHSLTRILWTRVVNLRLEKLGRAGRSGPLKSRKFRKYSVIFLEEGLIWNELIKFKFSFKNLSKMRIEIKSAMTGQAGPSQPYYGQNKFVTNLSFFGRTLSSLFYSWDFLVLQHLKIRLNILSYWCTN